MTYTHKYKLPLFLRNIESALPFDNLFIMHGSETKDLLILPQNDENGETKDLSGLTNIEMFQSLEFKGYSDGLKHMCKKNGFNAYISYDVVNGYVITPLDKSLTVSDINTRLKGAGVEIPADSKYFVGLTSLITALNKDIDGLNIAVMVDYYSESDPKDASNQLLEAHPHIEEALLNAYMHAKENFIPFQHKTSDDKDVILKHPLFITVRDSSILPPYLTSGIGIRQVAVSTPVLDDRELAIRVCLAPFIPDQKIAEIWEKNVIKIAKSTSGLSIRAVREIVEERIPEIGSLHLIEESKRQDEVDRITIQIINTAKEYRVGLTENPWENVMTQIKDSAITMKKSVKGQDYAVEKVSKLLKMAALNITSIDSKGTGTAPRGVLFFAGPTGVGKTELTKTIAKLVFGSEDDMIRFDMSEFSEEHSQARLIGSPPGYVGFASGGELTNAIKEKPFSVVLFDEIEKASPKIWDKFLQILSDGRLTDSRGDTVYFTESIIVFTSNEGVAQMQDWGSANPNYNIDEYRENYVSCVKEYFKNKVGRPEIYGRIGDNNIVVFNSITPEIGREIAELGIENISENIKNLHEIELRIEGDAKEKLLDAVTTESVLELGGRGVKNKLSEILVGGLTEKILSAKENGDKSISITDIESSASE